MCTFLCLGPRGKSLEELSKYLTYVLKDGLVYYDGHLCILENTNCKLKILYDCHDIPIMGHPRL
jgi:hypothetical protein